MDLKDFYFLSFLLLNHSSIFSILSISEAESNLFLCTGRAVYNGVLRCEPSKVFWFLISRRFNNSNACEGLGLTNLQRLYAHCMASNHNGFSELWAYVSTPRNVLYFYNSFWVQNTFLLNEGVGPVHIWQGQTGTRNSGQTGTRNSSTAGFCLWHFDYDPASAACAMSLCLGNRASTCTHTLRLPCWWSVVVLAWS